MASHYFFHHLLLTFSLILIQTNTKIHRSDKVRQQRRRKKKTELGQRECVCQLFLTSSSVSSKVWEAHKVQLPIWQLCQSLNTEVRFSQRLRHNGSLLSVLLSSLTSFLHTAHVKSQAWLFGNQGSFRPPGYTESSGTFCSLPYFKAACWPGPVTLLVLMRTWLCPVCVGRQRHTLRSHSGSFN